MCNPLIKYLTKYFNMSLPHGVDDNVLGRIDHFSRHLRSFYRVNNALRDMPSPWREYSRLPVLFREPDLPSPARAQQLADLIWYDDRTSDNGMVHYVTWRAFCRYYGINIRNNRARVVRQRNDDRVADMLGLPRRRRL